MNIVMKRIRNKNSGEVLRVPEKCADALVKTGDYVYTTRAAWKAAGREM